MVSTRRRRRIVASVAALLVSASLVWAPAQATYTPPSSTSGPTLSTQLFLDRLVNPAAALAPLPPGTRVVQHSSHDRTGGNDDVASFDPVIPLLNTPSYLRTEAGEFVLFDEQRPGCVTRTWFTGLGTNGAEGDLSDVGNLRFFFDGETEPRLDVPANALFAGTMPGFPVPLVGNAAVSSGGDYSYVPLCFHSLVIRATPQHPTLAWFQIAAVVAPHGTPVETWHGDQATIAAVNAAADALRTVGSPPPTPASVTRHEVLYPFLDTALDVAGNGTMRYLRVHASPFADALSNVVVQVFTAGSPIPDVQVPLGDLFGDGLAARPVRSIAFGMDPSTETGYFALPVPFSDGLRIELLSNSISAPPIALDVDAWIDPSAPASSQRLIVERSVETTHLGVDHHVLRATGAGRLAAWVLDIEGQPGSGIPGGQSYMEGDDRVYVDGSRSPSIYGTGTEDNFNGGFYYANGAFTLPTHGAGALLAPTPLQSSQSQYRVFAGDAPTWSSAIAYDIEHGTSDENIRHYSSTTFSYRSPATLVETDAVTIGDAASEAAHALTGVSSRINLAAYFEGDHDGTVPLPLVPDTGSRIAPPPEVSPEGVTAVGATFTESLDFTVAVASTNCGVLLRRLVDDQQASAVDVLINGQPAGRWSIAANNNWKRWLDADLDLPPAFTTGRRTLEIALVPDTGTNTVFALTAFSRSCPPGN